MKIVLDTHAHTIVSGHAYNTLYEMARAAADHGMKVFGSTDHAPGGIQGTCNEVYFKNFKVIPKHLFGLRLLMGCEVDIIDYQGSVDLKESTLSLLDYAIASIHPFAFTAGSRKENTLASVRAFQNPYVKILGHPDDGRFPLDYDELVREARQAQAVLEVNNSSLNPQSARQGGRENITELLKTCMKYDQPVIMGTDSHMCFAIGAFDDAEQLMRELEFPKELVLNYDPENIRKLINITL